MPADIPLDVRMDVAGFGGVYYWGVLVRPEAELELEPQQLKPGSSLAGWVQDHEGSSIAGADISLYPLEADVSRNVDDLSRTATRRNRAKTNARGFFQLAGLDAGIYRLVSEAKGHSPATLAEIRVARGEALVWPRAIVHAPTAILELSLDPPTDREGEGWTVELTEDQPLHLEPKQPLVRTAGDDGRLIAGNLRADIYEVQIKDRTGSVLEVRDLDLREGGRILVSLSVRSVAVRGDLRVGDDPLDADLAFVDFSGRVVLAKTSASGEFETAFPAGGTWTPSVRYPRGRGSTVRLAPVVIVPAAEGALTVHLKVPGGRIRGRVVSIADAPERAAIHVVRDGAPLAQVVTGDDGFFDFIGIAKGNYAIEAEGKESTTSQPVPIELDENESKDIRVVLTPLRRIVGTVVTPSGTPASGAVVHILSEDGQWWTRVVSDTVGRFEYRRAARGASLTLVVLTYMYPAAIVHVPANQTESILVNVKGDGGVVWLRHGTIPHVRRGPVTVPARAFYFPEPYGRYNGGVYLETGAYVVCPDARPSAACRDVTVGPSAEIEINFKAQDQKERTSE